MSFKKTTSFHAITAPVLPTVHQLNQHYKDLLSPLSLEDFKNLMAMSFYAKQSYDGKAFLLAFDDAAPYQSQNYQWFQTRYKNFTYIDRVAVDSCLQKHGIAKAFYDDVTNAAKNAGHSLLCAEVNIKPLNQPSITFHEKMGFEKVDTGNVRGKTVQYFIKNL